MMRVDEMLTPRPSLLTSSTRGSTQRWLLGALIIAKLARTNQQRCAIAVEDSCWAQLSSTQAAAATVLGWTQEGWDCVRERGGSASLDACAVPALMSRLWASSCTDVLLYSRETCEGSGRCIRGINDEIVAPPPLSVVGEASWSAADIASGVAGEACAEHQLRLSNTNYTGSTIGFWAFSGGGRIAMVQNRWIQGLTESEQAAALALGWSDELWNAGSHDTTSPPITCRAAHGEHVASTLEGRAALLGFGASCRHPSPSASRPLLAEDPWMFVRT